MYYAHSLPNSYQKADWQPLHNHLEATVRLSEAFAADFDAKEAGRLAGLLHDLGKYSIKFQHRLSGGESVDHSTAGALKIADLAPSGNNRIIGRLLAYCIAGHHSGLPDTIELNSRFEKSIEPIDPVWMTEIDASIKNLWPENFKLSTDRSVASFQLGFLGRMLFSCLVDADFKDTEQFYAAYDQQTIDRVWPLLQNDIDALIKKFDKFISKKINLAPKSELNDIRATILNTVRAKAREAVGLFTLTVPTGGGKTLSSFAFALEHAKAHGLNRIIYAIPFTSIIDQTAAVFREILGDDYILEHHSSIDNHNNASREQRDKLRLAMEDWAAPIIITTNVQFFESLFSNRPSRCRKLHNLTRSLPS